MSRYWIGGTGTWTDTAHWSDTSGGAGGFSVPTSTDDVVFDGNSFSANGQSVSIAMSVTASAKSVDFTGVTETVQLILTTFSKLNLYGNFTGVNNLTVTRGTSNGLIQIFGACAFNSGYSGSNGMRVDIAVELPNGTDIFELTDDLSMSGTLTIKKGTFNTNDYDVYPWNFYATNATNPITLNFGSSTIKISPNITQGFTISSTNPNLTLNAGTSELRLSGNGTRTYDLGGKTYHNITIPENLPAAIATILGSNTINTLTIGATTTVKFQSGKVTTLTDLVTEGTLTDFVTIRSTTNGSKHFLSKSGGTLRLNYLDIKDSEAFGGADWFAGADSIDSGNNTGWVFSDPIFYREAKGAIVIGGFAERTYRALRNAIGTIRIGGKALITIRKETNAIETKTYLYKVYDPDGNYIESWSDVVSEPMYTEMINELGSVMEIELARNSDSLGQITAPLQTQAGDTITTEAGKPLLATVESRNQVGDGSSVNHNNRVDVFVFYGVVEPLLTEAGEEITTEDGSVILAVLGAPNGRRIFTGFISEISSRYGGTETTIVQISSYGYDLGQFLLTDTGNTRVSYSSTEVSDIVIDAMNKFATDSAGYGTYTTYLPSSIEDTGITITYEFNANTIADVIKKSLEFAPSNFYFRVGLGDNTLYFKQKSTTPDHLFYLGEHIKDLDLKSYIGASINDVLFVGGGDPALLRRTTATPADGTRRTLSIESDGRVEVNASADILSQGIIDQKNKKQYRSTVVILDKTYDIESIHVGDVVGFRNFGNYVDSQTMQVVALTYTPEAVQLQLDSMPPTVNKRLEDIKRNLKVTELISAPSAPS